MRALAVVALVLGGCGAAGPDPEAERGERLVVALCHALRLSYDERVARENVPDPPAPPAPEEVAAAWDRVHAALNEHGVVARDVTSEVVVAARDVLLARDVVALPPAAPHADPGLCLARVVHREVGLSREVDGRTVRYRRVDHDGLLLPDYPTYAALRLGLPVNVPLGRCAPPTVYVDLLEVRRRAGKGSAAHLDAAALAAEVELRQVVAFRYGDDLVLSDARARVLHHASVLLACVVEGDERFALAELERLAADDLGPPDVVLGARTAREALGVHAEGSPRDRARDALARLRR